MTNSRKEQLQIRMTEGEKGKVEELARKNGMKVAEWVRKRAMTEAPQMSNGEITLMANGGGKQDERADKERADFDDQIKGVVEFNKRVLQLAEGEGNKKSKNLVSAPVAEEREYEEDPEAVDLRPNKLVVGRKEVKIPWEVS